MQSPKYVDLVQELATLDRQEAERVADYQFKRQQIVADITAALTGTGVTAAVVPAQMNGTHVAGSNGDAPKKKRGKKGEGTGGTGREGPTTKQHILSVLRRSRTGLDLRGIVSEMTRLKESGEWQTETESVTGVVSQAMNGLRKDKYVKVEKNADTNRNVYTAIAQPATT